MNLGSVYIGVRAKTDQYKRDLANAKTMTEKAAVQLQHGIDSVNFKTLGIAASAAMAAMAYGFASLSKDAALLASRFETMGIVMNQVGSNAGYSANEMNKFDTSLRKTGISMIESRNSLTKMASAQLDLSKATDLARIAQDAAVIGQINSSEAFQRMIYGIQSGQTEVLKTIGINVSFQDSYMKVAKATGRAVTSFSQAEKAIMRQNAVIEYGSRIAGTYEAAMSTAGKKLSSFTRYVEDFKVKMGQAFGPSMVTLIDSATASMKQLQKEISKPETQEALTNISSDLSDIAVSLSSDIPGKFKKISDSLTGIWNIISYDPAIIEYGLVGLALGGKKGALLLGSIGHMVTWVQNLSAALGMASTGLISYNDIINSNFKELDTIVKSGGESINSLSASTQKLIDLNNELEILNAKINSGYGGAGYLNSLREQRIELQLKIIEQEKAIQKTIDAGAAVDMLSDKYFSFGGVGSAGLKKILDVTNEVNEKTKDQIKAMEEYQKLVDNLFKPIRVDDTWADDEKKYWDDVIQKAEEYQELVDNLFKPVGGRDTWAEDEAKFFEDIGKAQEKALRDQTEATQKALDDQEKAYEHMAENIHDIMADFWNDALDGQMNSWDDFMDYILDTFKQTFSEILAQASTEIVMSIFVGSSSSTSSTSSSGGVSSQIADYIVDKVGDELVDKYGSNIMSSVGNYFTGDESLFGGLFGSSGSAYYGGAEYMVAGSELSATATSSLAAGVVAAGFWAAFAAVAMKIYSEATTPQMGIEFMGSDATIGDYIVGMGENGAYASTYYLDTGTASENYDYNISAYDFENNEDVELAIIEYFDSVFAAIDEATGASVNDILKDYSYFTALEGGIYDSDLETGLQYLSDTIFETLIGGILTQVFPDAPTTEEVISTLVGSTDAVYDPSSLGSDYAMPGRDYSEWESATTDYQSPIYEDISHTVSAYADIFNRDFFDQITPEDGNEWDSLIGFIETVNNTDDFLAKFDAQMADFGETSYDAYMNIASITEIMGTLEDGVNSIMQVTNTTSIDDLVESWDTLIFTLEELHATTEELTEAEYDRGLAIGSILTGITADSLQDMLLNGGDLVTMMIDSINATMAAAFAEELMTNYGAEFNAMVAEAYGEGGMDSVVELMESVDFTGLQDEINTFVDTLNVAADEIATIGSDISGITADSLKLMLVDGGDFEGMMVDVINDMMSSIFAEDLMSDYGDDLNDLIKTTFDDAELLTPGSGMQAVVDMMNGVDFSEVIDKVNDFQDTLLAVAEELESINDTTGIDQDSIAQMLIDGGDIKSMIAEVQQEMIAQSFASMLMSLYIQPWLDALEATFEEGADNTQAIIDAFSEVDWSGIESIISGLFDDLPELQDGWEYFNAWADYDAAQEAEAEAESIFSEWESQADAILGVIDSVQEMVLSADQIDVLAIQNQMAALEDFFDSVDASDYDDFEETFRSILETLQEIQYIDLYKSQLQTIGDMKAELTGLEDEWMRMNMSSLYGTDLSTDQGIADFLKEILAYSAEDLVTATEYFGVSVEDAADDMITLANSIQETSDAFQGVADTIRDTIDNIEENYSLHGLSLSGSDSLTSQMKQFNLAVTDALSLDPDVAAAGAESLASLSTDVLDTALATATNSYEYKKIYAAVVGKLEDAEDNAIEQVDSLDLTNEILGDNYAELLNIDAGIELMDSEIANLLTETTFTTYFDDFIATFSADDSMSLLTDSIDSLIVVLNDMGIDTGSTTSTTTTTSTGTDYGVETASEILARYDALGISADTISKSFDEYYAETPEEQAYWAGVAGVSAEQFAEDIATLRYDYGYADGGISSGPASGYMAKMHGTEAHIPLGRGDLGLVIKNDYSKGILSEIAGLREDLKQSNQINSARIKKIKQTLDRVTNGGVSFAVETV